MTWSENWTFEELIHLSKIIIITRKALLAIFIWLLKIYDDLFIVAQDIVRHMGGAGDRQSPSDMGSAGDITARIGYGTSKCCQLVFTLHDWFTEVIFHILWTLSFSERGEPSMTWFVRPRFEGNISDINWDIFSKSNMHLYKSSNAQIFHFLSFDL